MSFETWLLFVLTCIVGAATPGPGNLSVISTGFNHGARKSVLVILGILSGLLMLSVLAIAGFSAVLLASERLFRWVQFAGAAYILYLGIRLLRSPSVLKPSGPETKGRGPWRFFLHGIAVSVVNPKSIGFFVALLPPFINPQGNLALQYTILISTQMMVTLLVLLSYSLSTRRLAPWLREYGGAFNKVTGGLFVGLAVFFAQAGRS